MLNKPEAETPTKDPGKKAYSQPRLIEYGALKKVTANGTGAGGDGSGMKYIGG